MAKSMDDFFGLGNTLENLENVLDQFLGKCEELGVHIGADPGKLDKIRNFPELNNRDKVASLIGLVKTLNNWTRALSMKMEKIRELNQKGVEFHWDIPHTEEFEKVKEHLIETTKIATWDASLPLCLYADAAKTGVWAMSSHSHMVRRSTSSIVAAPT